ncbi:MAG TPA: deoxyribonuclease IV [Myxococcaceae bacterium]|nr:deoxyribonuclease IV [Myxococcaceae bacterium]
MLIGAHVSIAGGVSRAFERAQGFRAKSLQIFTKTARGWFGAPLAEEERSAFRHEARRTGLPAIAHGSYLANLATEDVHLRAKSIACISDELTRCETLGVPYLVIHPGGHSDERKGLRLIASALDEIHAHTAGFRARIALEVTAGQGNCLGWRFEHIAQILTRARRGDRLGVCLDTCHLFAAGYDISTPKGYESVMTQLDRVIGLKRVTSFHLNDCKKPLGCRVDRHEEIGKGTLGLAPFRCLVRDPRFRACVGVLETPFPERYGKAIRLLESLAG